jgi:hypothetical protein
VLLHHRHVLERQLDAEVSPGHHHAIAEPDDLLQLLERLVLLDLGDDQRLASHLLAGLLQVDCALYEAEPHVVDVVGSCELEVATILVGHEFGVHDHAGQVNPLVRLHLSIGQRNGMQLGALHALHLEGDAAVVEENPVAFPHAARETCVRHRDGSLGTRRVTLLGGTLRHKAIALAFRHSDRLRQGSDPDPRALKVAVNGDGASQIPSQVPQLGDDGGGLFVARVGKVDPDRVGAGLHEGTKGIRVAAGRTHRAQNLGSSQLCSHLSSE